MLHEGLLIKLELLVERAAARGILDRDASLRPLLGGLGKYPTTSTHGPFIHVDTRGYRARW